MFPLFRSLDKGAEAGESLPVVWQTLDQAGINFFRGDVSMIAGPPGAGKSILALQYAIKAQVPTMYLSCDMGPYLTAVRAAAMVTGERISDLKEEMLKPEVRDKYRLEVATNIENVSMAYASRPTPERIMEMELSFRESWGVPPSLFIVDNMMNLYSGSENEWTGLRELSHVLHYVAQDLGSAVLELHHVNLGGYNINYPAPLWAIKGQISELPALILTIAKEGGQMRICPVKNRHGKSDYAGDKFVALDFDEDRGRITDPIPQTAIQPVNQPDWLARGMVDA